MTTNCRIYLYDIGLNKLSKLYLRTVKRISDRLNRLAHFLLLKFKEENYDLNLLFIISLSLSFVIRSFNPIKERLN